MRIRLPELMARAGIANAHALSKASDGRIPVTTAYRLISSEGRLDRISHLLEALCDVLQVGPGELLERETPGVAPRQKKSAAKRPPAKKSRGA